MNRVFRLEAQAKINFFLKITERLDDGYHNIDTLMCPIELSDTLYFSLNLDRDILDFFQHYFPESILLEAFQKNDVLNTSYNELFTSAQQKKYFEIHKLSIHFAILNQISNALYFNDGFVQQDNNSVQLNLESNNSVLIALDTFLKALILRYPSFSKIQKQFFLEILLIKNLPFQAGLGAGSSDAAQTLFFLSKLFPVFSRDDLHKMALQVGADVPFLLDLRLARCLGKGEILNFLPEDFKLAKYPCLIVKAAQGISTAKAFSLWDKMPSDDSFDANLAMDYFIEYFSSSSRLESFSNKQYLKNIFLELAEVMENPPSDLFCALDFVASTQPLFYNLSGSGSAIFAIYKDTEHLDHAFESLKNKIKNVGTLNGTYLAKTKINPLITQFIDF